MPVKYLAYCSSDSINFFFKKMFQTDNSNDKGDKSKNINPPQIVTSLLVQFYFMQDTALRRAPLPITIDMAQRKAHCNGRLWYVWGGIRITYPQMLRKIFPLWRDGVLPSSARCPQTDKVGLGADMVINLLLSNSKGVPFGRWWGRQLIGLRYIRAFKYLLFCHINFSRLSKARYK